MRAGEERQGDKQPRMTMRVYTVNRNGTITTDRGKVCVMVGEKTAPMMSSVFPPCECPRHRAGGRQ